MSLRRVDPRFALPWPIRTATVLGDLEEWRDGLTRAGIELRRPEEASTVDLAVAPARLAASAATLGAEAVLIEGRADRALRRHGYQTTRLLLRPDRARPALALSLEQRLPTAYAVEHWGEADRRWKAARTRLAAILARRGLLPPFVAAVVSIGVRRPGPPRVIAAAAAEHGIPAGAGWTLALGQGDALSRNVFYLFEPGARLPSWVLKFGRIPGYAGPFDGDRLGLELAAAAGNAISAHVPTLLGRLDIDGLEASLETAAPGRRLRELLLAAGPREPKIRLVERVADWIIAFGLATRSAADDLASERRRLAGEVLPRWSHLRVDGSLLSRLAGTPAVGQHNDLGSWNVVVLGGEFTVVDWESAAPAGLPLWDLLYFFADALVLLDGTRAPEHRPAALARLFRGDAPSSSLLFAWVRRAVAAYSLDPSAVGAIATLCWLHHSLSGTDRDEELAERTPGERQPQHGLEAVAEVWLDDPVLGAGWSRWRES